MRVTQLAFLLAGYLSLYAAAAPLATVGKIEDSSVQTRELTDALVPRQDLPFSSICPSGVADCDEDFFDGEDPDFDDPDFGGLDVESFDKRGAAKPKPKKTTGTTGTTTAPKKSADYEVVEKAAKKKGKTLAVGQTYLLIDMGSGVIAHHRLIASTVVKNGETLDVTSQMTELVKDDKDGKCASSGISSGDPCDNQYKDTWSCAAGAAKGTKYKFAGTAAPEFADPVNFKLQGEQLINKNKKYNIITNNCQTFARKYANIASA